jgi:hypothetical protein
VPRFFFHLYDDLVSLDDEGAELADAGAARSKAVRDAREIACAEVLEGHLNRKHRIEVVDESDSIIAIVEFGDAVKLES